MLGQVRPQTENSKGKLPLAGPPLPSLPALFFPSTVGHKNEGVLSLRKSQKLKVYFDIPSE